MGPTDCETKCLVQSITIFEGFGSFVVVDSLFIDAPIVCVFFVGSLFCKAVLGALSIFPPISLKKRELVALL